MSDARNHDLGSDFDVSRHAVLKPWLTPSVIVSQARQSESGNGGFPSDTTTPASGVYSS